MKDLAVILIIGFGIAVFIGGIIGFSLLEPKLSADRSQWFKRSVLSSFLLVAGICALIFCMDARNLLSTSYKALWNSIMLMLEYLLLGGSLLALLNYGRLLMLEKYAEMMERLTKRPNNRRK